MLPWQDFPFNMDCMEAFSQDLYIVFLEQQGNYIYPKIIFLSLDKAFNICFYSARVLAQLAQLQLIS